MKNTNVTAVVLAGGRGKRMGGKDKGLIDFAGKPIIEHIIQAITPQCDEIIINANRHIERYGKYGHRVIADEMNNFQGPLAGFLVALEHNATPLLITLPCDAPQLPNDLVSRLKNAMQKANADVAVVHDGIRLQPVYALIKTRLSNNLKEFLSTGDRKIDRWYALNHTIQVDFSDKRPLFLNINTPDQQQKMQSVEGTT